MQQDSFKVNAQRLPPTMLLLAWVPQGHQKMGSASH